MRKFLKYLFTLLIFGVLMYQYRTFFFPAAPCSQPIPYSLGTFDNGFGISKDYFLSALTDAEAIWEKPNGNYLGKQLFVYNPADTAPDVLKINLIYDYRQQATAKLASLGIVVKDDRATYDSLKAKLTPLQTQYTTDKNTYDAELADYNQKLQAYNTEVQYWNGKGGAPQQQYEKVQAEKAALDAQATQLKNLQITVNNLVDEINALVVTLNHLVSVLNLSVNQYNTVNGARGESFEEGVYSSNGITRSIDIYEFSDRAKLVRVLAHELGHALGLAHSEDPKAIMYKLNQGNNESLTASDLAELKAKCGIK